MTTDIAIRLGNTFISAVSRQPAAATPARPSHARRLAQAIFRAPGRLVAWLERRQAARDALVRYAMNEGREGPGRNEIERAVLLTGRADMLFPSYFVNAHRR
jgi:hypothetical protein